MARVRCLGAGLVGSYVAQVLADRGHQVELFDLSIPDRLCSHPNITIRVGDVMSVMEEFRLEPMPIVVNMLPGGFGHFVTTLLSDTPTTIVDLSFCAIEPSVNDARARESGCRILWDTGIAPGLSNLLLAEAHRQLGILSMGVVRVGGNPSEPDDGWSYMAPFSPSDVIEEYTRPSRVIREGEVVALPALSERHLIHVEGKGEMEAFLTDGLRSVLNTIPAHDLAEYTVRWPGHIDKFLKLSDSGELDVHGLLNEWAFDGKRSEFTWLEVAAESKDGEMRWVVSDEGAEDGSSMARTTGLVTIACVELLAENRELLPAGVHPPEALPARATSTIIEWMRENGVTIEGPDIET